MAYKRSSTPVEVNVTDSGKLLPDFPAHRLAPSDYVEKINWRRTEACDQAIVGWDYPAPMGDWLAEMMGRFDSYAPCEAIRGIRRPNGTYAVVACGGGLIKAFDYDADNWVTIGLGYSVKGQPNFTYWQIEDVAGYAVFNNGRDLMAIWQIGDAAVTPAYEFREQGYAACATITVINGILMCANILEIDPAQMGMVMNGSDPYGTIEEGGDVAFTRIGFERVWSNFGDPNDFAAVVSAVGTAGSPNIVMRWPMASLAIGDVVTFLGAGTAGGNLTTTISNISGYNVTLASNVLTSTDNQFSKAGAIDSLVGSDELEGDGSPILIEAPLKNQLVSYKTSGEIFQTFYTGNVTIPFSAQAIVQNPEAYRPIRFPRALINIADQYHLFPGDQHFYKFSLSAQQPEMHPMFHGAEQALFYRYLTTADQYDVWAANNVVTDEAYFVYPVGDEETSGGEDYSSNRALAYCYSGEDESLAEVDEFRFMCASSINKPTAGWTCDETERWFVMGAFDGTVTLYGETNLGETAAIITMRRYGQTFDRTVASGFLTLNSNVVEKLLERYTLLLASPVSSGPVTFELYGTKATNIATDLLLTKTLGADGIVARPHFRKMYFQYRLTSASDELVRFAGHVWLVRGSDTQQVQQSA